MSMLKEKQSVLETSWRQKEKNVAVTVEHVTTAERKTWFKVITWTNKKMIKRGSQKKESLTRDSIIRPPLIPRSWCQSRQTKQYKEARVQIHPLFPSFLLYERWCSCVVSSCCCLVVVYELTDDVLISRIICFRQSWCWYKRVIYWSLFLFGSSFVLSFFRESWLSIQQRTTKKRRRFESKEKRMMDRTVGTTFTLLDRVTLWWFFLFSVKKNKDEGSVSVERQQQSEWKRYWTVWTLKRESSRRRENSMIAFVSIEPLFYTWMKRRASDKHSNREVMRRTWRKQVTQILTRHLPDEEIHRLFAQTCHSSRQ